MLDLVPLSDGLIRWFFETTVVAFVLTIVALFTSRLPRVSPAVKHVFWLVILIKLMTPPLIHWPWSQRLALTFPQAPASVTPASDPGVENVCVVASINSEDPFEQTGDDPSEISEISDIASISQEDSRVAAEETVTETPHPAGLLIARAESFWPGSQRALLALWLAGTIVTGLVQAKRVFRFQRGLRAAADAPEWLCDQAEVIAERIGVRPPAIRLVDHPGSPLLWCFGRPVLLVPYETFKTLKAEQWPGVLAHELAHLRRGDPWVSRLELLAGLVWWWNPLFWLVRSRLDFEAELACDAWVLWVLPERRLGYAESLVQLCGALSTVQSPAPMLGVTGAGRSFERRLLMILCERVSHHASLPGILVAAFLGMLALPSWTFAEARPVKAVSASLPVIVPAIAAGDAPVQVASVAIVNRDDEPADDDSDDDANDDDDDKPKAARQKKSKVKPAPNEAKAVEDIEARVKKALGPDFEKKMEEIGERIGKAMEEKFGPGSDFEKKIEAMGKEIEAKFGPEFEKKMEAVGKEIQEKLGPGSEFFREMTKFGERMAKEFKKDSGDIKELPPIASSKPKAKPDANIQPAKPRANAPKRSRAERIERLEARINDLIKELKNLQEEDDDEKK